MNKLRELRTSKGLTQAALAKQLHLDPSTITKWETGESMPKTKLLPELAKLLHCQINDLFDEQPYEH